MKTKTMKELIRRNWLIMDIKSNKYIADIQPKSWSSKEVDLVTLEENACIFSTRKEAETVIKEQGYNWGFAVWIAPYRTINNIINLACQEHEYGDYENFLTYRVRQEEAEEYKLELELLTDEEVQEVIADITSILRK